MKNMFVGFKLRAQGIWSDIFRAILSICQLKGSILYQWITGMTDADYTSYSTAHKAMGSFIKNNRFYMKNVENIGIETLGQHYELKYHAANHIQFYSMKSKAYIVRWFPATVGVSWELYVKPVSSSQAILFV